MNEKTKYLLKNTGILTISNFATKILSVFLIPLYTGVLSTAEYGTYDLVTSSASLLFPILTLNIVDATMRFSMEKDCSVDDIGRIGTNYILRSSVIFFVLLFIVDILGILPDARRYFVYIFLYYVTSSFYNFLIQFAKGCEKVKAMGVAGVLASVCTILFNILFLVVIKIGLTGFFLATILSQTIASLYFIYEIDLIKKVKNGKKNKQLEKEMLIYCVPLIATAVSWWINNAADKYVVTFFCGLAANGVLSISYKLPNIMNMFQNIFTQAWQISAVKEYGNKETSVFYGNTFIVINVLMCAVCSWIILLARPLAHLLFANDFYSAWMYVPFLLVSSVINCASGLLGPILAANKNSKSMMWSAIWGALTNVVLNFILTYLFGIQGATAATVISSFVIYFVRKYAVGKDIYIEKYNIVLITWGMLIVQSIIEIWTTQWWIELIIMAFLFVLNINVFKKILNMLLGFVGKSK